MHNMEIYFDILFGGGIMGKIIVNGGNRLNGEVNISGAKNAILPILAATIGGNESTLFNVPNLRDVEIMVKILNSLVVG